MKRILTILAIFISISGYSQSIFRPAVVFTSNFCSEEDIIAHSTFINKFSSPNLRFVRIQNTLSSQWTSAFCDCEYCRGIEVDTANFYIKVGDSCVTSAHFYPLDKKGLGVMQIKFFVPADPSNFVIGEFHASCWGAYTIFLDKEQLKISPNPASTALNVQFGSGEPYTISIVSADGKLLMNERVSGLSNNVDISHLDAGLYSVKAESSGKVFYSKFIKL